MTTAMFLPPRRTSGVLVLITVAGLVGALLIAFALGLGLGISQAAPRPAVDAGAG